MPQLQKKGSRKKCVDSRKRSNTWRESQLQLKKKTGITIKKQSINNNKKKKEDFFHATLLVNDVPITFIIDIGSPVTLIPQRLFNDTSEVTKWNTSYKDVNDNKIEFLGQTIASVKTNNTTEQLPLLITRAHTRQTRNYHKDWDTQKRKRTKILSGSNPISFEIHKELISTNGHPKKTVEETKRLELDTRTHRCI